MRQTHEHGKITATLKKKLIGKYMTICHGCGKKTAYLLVLEGNFTSWR